LEALGNHGARVQDWLLAGQAIGQAVSFSVQLDMLAAQWQENDTFVGVCPGSCTDSKGNFSGLLAACSVSTRFQSWVLSHPTTRQYAIAAGQVHGYVAATGGDWSTDASIQAAVTRCTSFN
jgi:hypothetical protein